MDLIPIGWPLIVQALAWFLIVCAAFATIGALATAAIRLEAWVEDRREHVKNTSTRCGDSANAWADQYDRPICGTCRTGRVAS